MSPTSSNSRERAVTAEGARGAVQTMAGLVIRSGRSGSDGRKGQDGPGTARATEQVSTTPEAAAGPSPGSGAGQDHLSGVPSGITGTMNAGWHDTVCACTTGATHQRRRR